MTEERTIYNGINGSTGKTLFSPSAQELLAVARAQQPDQVTLREMRWWVERYGIDDPDRAEVHRVDVKQLSSAGWCVVFAHDISDEVKKALRPLLEHRRAQAGMYYREYVLLPGQTKREFLALAGAGPGPADPRYVAYYILIVGDPGTISFRFQYELDMQYAVGRIFFERTENYASYAKSVVEAETSTAAQCFKRVSFFATSHPDDPATQRTASELVAPLASVVRERFASWDLQIVQGEEAVKARLGRLLGGDETPSLLFTATHGMYFDPTLDPDRFREYGALLCQDWPGRATWGERPIPPEFYFSLIDLAPQADLRRLIVFLFACYSAGIPELSDFDSPIFAGPRRIAPRAGLSRLAQGLLSNPVGGALAVLGHIDRAWTVSFSWSKEGQTQIFENVLERLLDGHPIGSATEFINQRYAELSVELSGFLLDLQYQAVSEIELSRTVRASNDSRNFIVLGDPAVRLV